jgi:hypothetical protein
MNLMKNQHSGLLQSSWMLLVSFIFAVSLFSYRIFIAERVGTDDLVQIGTAVNFIDGYGFVQLNGGANATVTRQFFYDWPYALRVIHVPLLLLTSKDVETTILLSKVFGFIVLLLGFASVIAASGIPNKQSVMVWVFFCSPLVYAPVRYMGAVDLLTLGGSLFALSCLFFYFSEGRRVKHLVPFIICVALLPHCRYAYVPQTLMWLLLFVVVSIAKGGVVRSHIVALGIAVLGLVTAMSNPYFSSTSSKSMSSNLVAETAESFLLPIVPSYAVFFNALIPDFMIIHAARKLLPDLSSGYVALMMLSFAIISMLLLARLAFQFLNRGWRMAPYLEGQKLLELLLVAFILCDLIFYLYLFRATSYTPDVVSSEQFSYKHLAVVNRYSAPMQVAALLLFLFYSELHRDRLLRMALVVSVLFGSVHLLYLSTVFDPLDRNLNMEKLNNPIGSYGDALMTGRLVREMKQEGMVYFIDEAKDVEGRYRQVTPWDMAKANAAVMVHGRVEHFHMPDHTDAAVLMVVPAGHKGADGWQQIYAGNVYDLLQRW